MSDILIDRDNYSPKSSISSSSQSSLSSLKSTSLSIPFKTYLGPELNRSKEDVEEMVIEKTLSMEMDNKVEYYNFLVDKVYKQYLTISIKNQQSNRFKLLLAMLIIGSKNCTNYLKAFHYLSPWFWLNKYQESSFSEIIIEILRHYLMYAMNYYENDDNSDYDYDSMCNIINKVLSETLLSTFNDKKFEQGVRRMKVEFLGLVSVKNRKLILHEMKIDDKLNQFCQHFDIWARNIFKVVSTSDQYCFDNEVWTTKDIDSSLNKKKLSKSKYTSQKGLGIISEDDNKYQIKNDIEIESYDDEITELQENINSQAYSVTLDATPLSLYGHEEEFKFIIYNEETKENEDEEMINEEDSKEYEDKDETKYYEGEKDTMMKRSDLSVKQTEKKDNWWSEFLANLSTSIIGWEDYDSENDATLYSD